jgi:CBS domain-containing protein
MMTTHAIKRLPVMTGEKVVGIVSRADIVSAIARNQTSRYTDLRFVTAFAIKRAILPAAPTINLCPPPCGLPNSLPSDCLATRS